MTKKPGKPKARARKPREMETWALVWRAIGAQARFDVVAACQGRSDRGHVDAKEARRLAAWLLRFADWADPQ